jgi:hypothetical protein
MAMSKLRLERRRLAERYKQRRKAEFRELWEEMVASGELVPTGEYRRAPDGSLRLTYRLRQDLKMQ